MREQLRGKFDFGKKADSDERVYGEYREKVTSNNVFLCACRYK